MLKKELVVQDFFALYCDQVAICYGSIDFLHGFNGKTITGSLVHLGAVVD
jgi:hypothetical protein